MKTAIIFGVTGQDGSYLAELLLSKGYYVVGVSRRVSVPTTERISHILDCNSFQLIEGDVTDQMSVCRILTDQVLRTKRLEVYNLAAQSHVKTSFEVPRATTDATYIGCLNILEVIRSLHFAGNDIRFYQASSSEMYGTAQSMKLLPTGEYTEVKSEIFDAGSQTPTVSTVRLPKYENVLCQHESTPFLPCSPYAVAKLASHHLVNVYRQSYGLYACSGILFNHESERRGELFVTRKVSKYVGNLIRNADKSSDNHPKLKLGNLDAKRDWGHAADYVRGMWLMLQQEKPDDFVLATGETHSVRDFLVEAFKVAATSIHKGDANPFEVANVAQMLIKEFVETDSSLHRPCEVPYLRGDASKADRVLGWKPEISFKELVKRMVEHDSA